MSTETKKLLLERHIGSSCFMFIKNGKNNIPAMSTIKPITPKNIPYLVLRDQAVVNSPDGKATMLWDYPKK